MSDKNQTFTHLSLLVPLLKRQCPQGIVGKNGCTTKGLQSRSNALSLYQQIFDHNSFLWVFYLTTHSTHFIYGYIASDIWLRTILIVKMETPCRHIGYSFRLAARVLLYAPSHRQHTTYYSLCYTSRGALAGMRNNSMGPPHEGSIR